MFGPEQLKPGQQITYDQSGQRVPSGEQYSVVVSIDAQLANAKIAPSNMTTNVDLTIFGSGKYRFSMTTVYYKQLLHLCFIAHRQVYTDVYNSQDVFIL